MHWREQYRQQMAQGPAASSRTRAQTQPAAPSA
eukprot:CAMPEP_0206263084 /NCGR_PEP_ID=MMETSP0047_2-20121206/28616_1 /ASSEMBLY_ACC=CAM_ASM_000192 /TAXON_ID=195065 /ORGANISM="Chroomonas mesostigmatica_cf, Strain CCMP1168" /LENGTH=32 /DNA_ID= /DNA_START= /DNA_END= /DNA_ORIENTATION=